METGKEVVLVTGGSGFLGQHVVKHLQAEQDVAEIRVLDLRPYVNRLGHKARVPVLWLCGDLADESACEAAFRGVDLVIHCAALVDYSHPADVAALHRNNVREVVVSLCRRLNVPRLVATSSMEVVLVPYMRGGTFSLIINQTEARALPPQGAAESQLTPYIASKLRSERIILQANGTSLADGGVLRTVALRPPLMYGEEDLTLVPGLFKMARLCDNTLLQIGGTANRQQHAYVGNVAWAHVCAGRSLRREAAGAVGAAQGVAGLAVFVTDDTPKGDLLRLAQLLLTFQDVSGLGAAPLVRLRGSLLPTWLWFLAAGLLELLQPVLGAQLPVQPTAAVRYLASVVMLSRLRAETRLRYSPKYTAEEAVARSRAFYARSKDLAALV